MHIYAKTHARELPKVDVEVDFVVAGGGLSGACAAIAAAREGLRVALIQDRPVLGGNASSEVRLWALGATSHLGNNNRWAREGGVMGEILESNLYRNRQGNPVIFDMVLLDLVTREPNIQLFLNTAIFAVDSDGEQIHGASGFNSINETLYHFRAPQFCDATGDGVLGFLSGASFRVGAEDGDEFDEKMAPHDNFGHMLGHSIYFYTRHTAEPVDFIPPAFALADITQIPRYKRLSSNLNGCDLWWLEWGGRLDTVHDSEKIKWELWKIVWGVWHYIKNSGEFPDADNMTLEWVGLIPGKRESRRFIGDYMLNQKDIVEQRDRFDAVSFGGWSIDLHPADGVYSELDACLQYHSKGVYTIPFSTLYSRDIRNLFIGGRIISATHVAFGSTRVMCTCGQNGQVIGQAAALCHRQRWTPRQLGERQNVAQLQQQLMRNGGYIPRQRAQGMLSTEVRASSTWQLSSLAVSGNWYPLQDRCAVMLPLKAGEALPEITIQLNSAKPSELQLSLMIAERAYNHTPEISVASQTLHCSGGEQQHRLRFDYCPAEDRYVFLCFEANPQLSIMLTDEQPAALKTLWNKVNAKVAKHSRQLVDGDYGVDEFDFWLPLRRPQHVLPALQFTPALQAYAPDAVIDGMMRPSDHTHAWMADPQDATPQLVIALAGSEALSEIGIMFDNDFDHAMETSQWGHKERVSPHCVQAYSLFIDDECIAQVQDNYLSWRKHQLAVPRSVKEVKLVIHSTHGATPVVFGVHCF